MPDVLFLDTEFNGFGGGLISLALHRPDKPEQDWYEVLAIPEHPEPFVRDHVLPVVNRQPIGLDAFTTSLRARLVSYASPRIVADWPEDFGHLLRFLCAAGGKQLQFECTLELVLSGKLDSAIPHNALEDAKALARWYGR